MDQRNYTNYSPPMPGTIAFTRNSQSSAGYDTTFYTPNLTGGRITREEVERVLSGFRKISNSEIRHGIYFMGLVIIYALIAYLVSKDFEKDARFMYIALNCFILLYASIFLHCITTRSYYSNTNTLARYLDQCNNSYSHRGLKWSLFIPPDDRLSRSSQEVYLSQKIAVEQLAEANSITPQSIQLKPCSCCGGIQIRQGKNTSQSRSTDATNNQDLSSMQTKIIFYPYGFSEASFNSNFYIGALTDDRITLTEIDQVLSKISEIRRPYSKAVKLLIWMVITTYLAWVFVFVLDLARAYDNEESFNMKKPTITALVISLFFLCIVVYISRKGSSLIREYFESHNADFAERGLKWRLPGRFFNSVVLWKDYSGNDARHSNEIQIELPLHVTNSSDNISPEPKPKVQDKIVLLGDQE